MHQVYLSLGSNMGDRQGNLQKAQTLLEQHPQINVIKVSGDYQTSPVGGVIQDDFINQAMHIETSLDPYELLEYIHQVESQLHRKRLIHWGPRTIDIDILFFDKVLMPDPKLTIPHAEVFNRLFVLVPLVEIIDADFYQFEKVHQAIEHLEANTDQSIERVK